MFKKRFRSAKILKASTVERARTGLSSFEKLLGYSTLAISIAALGTAAYQVYLEQRAFQISQQDLLPNIVAWNEYYPKAEYGSTSQEVFLPPNHNVRLYSDLNFVSNISVEQLSYISVELIDSLSLERSEIRVPFDGYFMFCGVSIKPNEQEFSSCIGQDNVFEQDRLPNSLPRNEPLVGGIFVDKASFFTIFKVNYETLLKENLNEYIRINNFGVYKSSELASVFDDTQEVYRRAISVSKVTSSNEFYALLLKLVTDQKSM